MNGSLPFERKIEQTKRNISLGSKTMTLATLEDWYHLKFTPGPTVSPQKFRLILSAVHSFPLANVERKPPAASISPE